MYLGEQLVQDLQCLESQRVEGARMLIAGTINGLQKLQLDAEIDASLQINTSIWGIRSRTRAATVWFHPGPSRTTMKNEVKGK